MDVESFGEVFTVLAAYLCGQDHGPCLCVDSHDRPFNERCGEVVPAVRGTRPPFSLSPLPARPHGLESVTEYIVPPARSGELPRRTPLRSIGNGPAGFLPLRQVLRRSAGDTLGYPRLKALGHHAWPSWSRRNSVRLRNPGSLQLVTSTKTVLGLTIPATVSNGATMDSPTP